MGAALVVIALAWLWLVRTQIPDPGTEWPGPRGFPLLLGVVLALLGVWLIAFPDRQTSEHRIPDPRALLPAVSTVALLLLFAFLLDRAGFLIAAPLVVVLAMAGVLRMRRWVFITVFAVAFPLGCWAVFNVLLGIPLPR